MEHHLPYGIRHPTQVILPDLIPAKQAGTWFTYLKLMEGWVDLCCWFYTEMVYLSADSHPSK